MAENGIVTSLRPGLSPCYVCRSCKTVVGWHQHLLLDNVLAIFPDFFLLSDVQTHNVFVEVIPFDRGVNRLKTVYCGNCFNLLGWKIVVAGGPFAWIFEAGRYMIFSRGVLFWDSRTLEDPTWSPS